MTTTTKSLQIVDNIINLIDSVNLGSSSYDMDEEKKDASLDGQYVMGLDCSTQSLKLCVFDISHDADFACVAEINVHFDTEFASKYGVKNGVLEDAESHQVTAPTLMFVEALDIGLQRLQSQKLDFSKIIAISGSGQQHGSVFWNRGALQRLQQLDASRTLLQNLRDAFCVATGPVWMDSSTTQQCAALEEKVGASKLAQISGSRAYERFTGNQIAKISAQSPQIYADKTERISLISSFLCCVFVGAYAPIDVSDGSGMNLLDISTRKWSDVLLSATAKNLAQKLGSTVANSYDFVGNIPKYFVQRYGFHAGCHVIAFSGDNPCSLAGLMCYEKNDICVSLGTSDTLFAVTEECRPQNEGHVLCSPIHRNAYMILLCYKNGSIAREHIKNEYVSSWTEFNQLLNDAGNGGAGSNGRCAFYYEHPEILPKIKAGVYRFDSNEKTVQSYADGAADIRGIIESQFMAMRQHMQIFGVKEAKKILATGGASRNSAILQVLSDVFGVDVYCIETANSAAKGAALRALHGYQCRKQNMFVPFKDVVDSVGGPHYKLQCKPNLNNTQTYTKLLPRWKALQDQLPRYD